MICEAAVDNSVCHLLATVIVVRMDVGPSQVQSVQASSCFRNVGTQILSSPGSLAGVHRLSKMPRPSDRSEAEGQANTHRKRSRERDPNDIAGF